MIHLDTSTLIDALTDEGRMALSSIVIFEWQRGPRSAEEIDDQEALFPTSDCVAFGPVEAVIAAGTYRHVKRPRGREIDIAIAACAIAQDAVFWTLNPRDFSDIPDLNLLAEK